MTRKHFEAIARILNQYSIPHAAAGFDMGYNDAAFGIASDMADLFEAENPRFDREKFLTACGFAAKVES
jgi:hypothetical protein